MRFLILLHVCRAKLEISRIPKIVVACFVLHNIAKILHDRDFVPEVEIFENNNEQAQKNFVGNERQRGQEKRQRLAEIISNFIV